jgi:hypothetical protein
MEEREGGRETAPLSTVFDRKQVHKGLYVGYVVMIPPQVHLIYERTSKRLTLTYEEHNARSRRRSKK